MNHRMARISPRLSVRQYPGRPAAFYVVYAPLAVDLFAHEEHSLAGGINPIRRTRSDNNPWLSHALSEPFL